MKRSSVLLVLALLVLAACKKEEEFVQPLPDGDTPPTELFYTWRLDNWHISGVAGTDYHTVDQSNPIKWHFTAAQLVEHRNGEQSFVTDYALVAKQNIHNDSTYHYYELFYYPEDSQDGQYRMDLIWFNAAKDSLYRSGFGHHEYFKE